MREIELWMKKKYYSPDNYDQTSDRMKKKMRWENARDDGRSHEEQLGQDKPNIAVERVTILRFLKKQHASLPFNIVYHRLSSSIQIIVYHRVRPRVH